MECLMSKSLSLDGLLKNNRKPNKDKRYHERTSIYFEFKENKKDYALALDYWKKRKLATPLFWLVLDSLNDYALENGYLSSGEVIFKVEPDEISKYIKNKIFNI